MIKLETFRFKNFIMDFIKDEILDFIDEVLDKIKTLVKIQVNFSSRTNFNYNLLQRDIHKQFVLELYLF